MAKLPTGWLFIPTVVNKGTTIEVQKRELILCRDCIHFHEDVFSKIDGIPIIVAHLICDKWGDGCVTVPDGYCFMAEKEGRNREDKE